MAMKPKKIISSRGEIGVGGSARGAGTGSYYKSTIKVNTDPSRGLKAKVKKTPAELAAEKKALAAANKKLKR
jgi:hypothetical protein